MGWLRGDIPSLLATDRPNTFSITLLVGVFAVPVLSAGIGRMGLKRSLIGVDLALAQINHFKHLGGNRSVSRAVNIRYY